MNDKTLSQRKSPRLPGYDYSQSGVYFITICTAGRAHLFGEIADGEMVLNDYGKIVQEEWERTPIIRPEIEIDWYVVMPNHFHAIIFIIGDSTGRVWRAKPLRSTVFSTVGTWRAMSDTQQNQRLAI